MNEPLRIILVEDLNSDVDILNYYLTKNNIQFTEKVVENKETFLQYLSSFNPNIILSDYSLPKFNGMEALQIRNEMAPYVPFILITGSINEETAVECMKAGADDYLIKGNLIRLASAIHTAMEKKAAIRSKIKAEEALRESENKYRTIFEKFRMFFIRWM